MASTVENIRYSCHGHAKSSSTISRTGRAVPRWVEAECVLLHSGKDFLTWRSIMTKSAEEPGRRRSSWHAPEAPDDIDVMPAALLPHRSLVQYLARLRRPACNACESAWATLKPCRRLR